ncbi:mechanosensitive ion channel family protein [Rhodalgimonas zhirmunskyi]|uniref:Small-conductance mechanosensitive channel n=1 Tax=Rhodalgimonas zhirmunskyi TaxID=2964767 RepID=A0AAJ1X3S1_9RHOB|nr:mechanosensitive ion channel family protein [Rhodoalgimonas zhirmunskyi]MDQ2093578.1 mechanosensitive ion channel [Rhodoalgimonas zhirmunskyi]
MTRLLQAFLIALALFVMFSADAIRAQSSEQPSGTINVEDDAQHDAAIAVRIRDILSELGGYADVTTTVNSGVVTLRGTTLDNATAARLNEIVGRVEGVVAIQNKVTESTDVAERLNPAFERFLVRLKQLLAYTPLLAVALLAFVVVVLVGFFIARRQQPWDRLAPNAFIADIYRQLVRIAAVVAGLVVALDILGAMALLSTILGAAGIIGLAIGFAVKDTVENFIASIMLSIRQPFQPNDAIEIGGDEGKVIRLTSRATIILNWDGNQVRIPNSTVFKSRILNYSRNRERRFLFDITAGYGTDLAMALQLARDTVAGLPFVLDTPAVNVWIVSLGGSDISIRVTGWIDQTETSILAAKSEAIRQTLLAYEAAGIEMPEPTYRVLTGTIDGGQITLRASDGEAPAEAVTEKPSETPVEKDRASARAPTPKAPSPTAQAAAPATEVPPADAPDSVLNVGTSAEEELERIVDSEREAMSEDDLLNREGAAQE